MDVNINIQGSQWNGIPELRYLAQKTPLPPHAPTSTWPSSKANQSLAHLMDTLLKKKTRAGQVLPLGRKPPFEGTKKLEERQKGGGGRWEGGVNGTSSLQHFRPHVSILSLKGTTNLSSIVGTHKLMCGEFGPVYRVQHIRSYFRSSVSGMPLNSEPTTTRCFFTLVRLHNLQKFACGSNLKNLSPIKTTHPPLPAPNKKKTVLIVLI
jgi:hypothetical protein